MNPLQPEEIRLLCEIGFLAGARGDLVRASEIFGALEGLRPQSGGPYIGMAMAQLNRRQHDDAVRTLERGAAMVSAEHLADVHAYRALALRLAGRSGECDRAIQAAGNHPLARELAATPARSH